MKNKILRIILGLLIISATYLLIKILYIDTSIVPKIPNKDLIKNEYFSILTSKDTILSARKGTRLLIKKNSITDSNGNLINDIIQFELKEILTKSETVKAGLTTKSNEKILETGGMLFINAFYKGEKVKIADSKSIIAIVPTNKIKSGMQQFVGQLNEKGINWTEPVKLANYSDTFTIVKAIGLVPDGYTEKLAIEKGLILRDTLRFSLSDTATTISEKGQNNIDYYRKYNNGKNYILKILDFGWYNIDRTIEFTETIPINLDIKIKDRKRFNKTNTYMIFNDLDIILNGIDLSDGRVLFSNLSDNQIDLPMNEKIGLLSFGYKNEKIYSDFIEIILQDSVILNLNLKKTTIEEMEKFIDLKY